MKKILFYTLLALTFGCNSTKTKKDTMSMNTLQDGYYTVVSILGSDVSAENLTLDVSEAGTSISGFSGCNNYFGAIENKADGFVFSGIGATKKFCPATMKTEKSYLGEMTNVVSAASQENLVHLKNGNGETIIVLKK